MSRLRDLEVGDPVIRKFCGLEMPLVITEITEDRIFCGDWCFDRNSGFEIDDLLGWGSVESGSYITAKLST